MRRWYADWTKEEEETLVKMWRAHARHKEIAIALERTVPGVRTKIRRMRALGLPPRGRNPNSPPPPLHSMAERHDAAIMRERHIMRMTRAGFSTKEIADDLGTTENSVIGARHRARNRALREQNT